MSSSCTTTIGRSLLVHTALNIVLQHWMNIQTIGWSTNNLTCRLPKAKEEIINYFSDPDARFSLTYYYEGGRKPSPSNRLQNILDDLKNNVPIEFGDHNSRIFEIPEFMTNELIDGQFIKLCNFEVRPHVLVHSC